MVHTDYIAAAAGYIVEREKWRILKRDENNYLVVDDLEPLGAVNTRPVTEVMETKSYTTRPFSSKEDASGFIHLRCIEAALRCVTPEQTTRNQILDFSRAFGRPVHDKVTRLSVSDRLLLGNLMLEEVVEYIVKGLGLDIMHADGIAADMHGSRLTLVHNEGRTYDPIEAADGLGDINVVAHFNSNWHGWNLDAVTTEIHESNMSKLDDNGAPIINGESAGALDPSENPDAPASETRLFDPTKPPGKILKGPNFSEPNIAAVIYHNYSE